MVLIVGDQGMTTTIDVPTRVNRGVSGGIQPNAHKDIQKIEAQAVSFRRSEQEAQLQSRLAEGVKAGATTLWNIMVAEEAKKMWKQTPIPQSCGRPGNHHHRRTYGWEFRHNPSQRMHQLDDHRRAKEHRSSPSQTESHPLWAGPRYSASSGKNQLVSFQ
ncbi:hypothetical protein IV203_030584 [Nitzschia inconspicua]|uniref:Uncharacterized protein n=1 Tax=Nitzschia inconspicua TaxID=303405 RepID=A0A9K3Q1W7_9STRA|nr:hypothetical protein IV203_030584 [Nitzschia inconspicua]